MLTLANIYGFITLHWRIIGSCVLGLAVICGVLFGIDRCSNWRSTRQIDKTKANIANTVNQISNIKTQIGNLEIQQAEKQGELKRDVEELHQQVFGRDEAKMQTNQALANFNAALKSNSNVNATVADIQKALDKLDQQ